MLSPRDVSPRMTIFPMMKQSKSKNIKSKIDLTEKTMIFFSIYIYYREQEDSSLNDESGEANEETIAKPPVMLKRRRTKSIMPPSKSKAAQ